MKAAGGPGIRICIDDSTSLEFEDATMTGVP
jgi:hypothetical protein